MPNPVGITTGLPEAAVREIIRRELNPTRATLAQAVSIVEVLNAARTRGTVTLTFAGSVTSNIQTVNHGMSTTPNHIQLTDNNGVAWCLAQARTITATSFQVQGIDVTGTARTGTNLIGWEAVA